MSGRSGGLKRGCCRFLKDIVPADLVGGMPKNSASAIWSGLQSEVEENARPRYAPGRITLDVVKALV